MIVIGNCLSLGEPISGHLTDILQFVSRWTSATVLFFSLSNLEPMR